MPLSPPPTVAAAAAAVARPAQLRASWTANATSATKAVIPTVVASVERDDLPGIPVRIATPPGFDPKGAAAKKLLLYLHGGAYILGTCEVQWPTVGLVSKLLGVRVLCPNYRLAPEHPFPAALDDAVAVYKHAAGKYGAQNIALLGDSAGGGLALALLLRARALGLPYPAAVALFSPWAELTKAGDTQVTLAGVDPKLEYDARLRSGALGYAGGDAARLKDPLLSPLRANWSVAAVGKLPPTLIQVGALIRKEGGLQTAWNCDGALRRLGFLSWVPHRHTGQGTG
jgi:epsilon-lactone hydrolase